MNTKHISMMVFLLLVSGQVRGLQDQLLLHGSLNQLIDQAKVSGSPKSTFDAWTIEAYALTHLGTDVFYNSRTKMFYKYVNYVTDSVKLMSVRPVKYRNWTIVIDFSKSILVPTTDVALQKFLKACIDSLTATTFEDKVVCILKAIQANNGDLIANPDIAVVLLCELTGVTGGKVVDIATKGSALLYKLETSKTIVSNTGVATMGSVTDSITSISFYKNIKSSVLIGTGDIGAVLNKTGAAMDAEDIVKIAISVLLGNEKEQESRFSQIKKYKVLEAGLLKILKETVGRSERTIDINKATQLAVGSKQSLGNLLNNEYPSGCLIRITPPLEAS